MFKMGMIFYAVLLGISMAITAVFHDDLSYWFPARSWQTYAMDVVYGVSIGLAIVLLSRLMLAWVKDAQKLSEEFGRLLGPLKWWEILGLALASGIAEEALFRVALQPLWGFWVCSILFGLIHTGPKKYFINWTLFALAFGFAIGWIFEVWPGIVLPATIHATVNGINIGWLVKKYGHTNQGLERFVTEPLPYLDGDEDSPFGKNEVVG